MSPGGYQWGYYPGTLPSLTNYCTSLKDWVPVDSNKLQKRDLTHWGRVTHICVGNLTIIGSDNGLSPGRRQAITWTNVGILLIGPLGTNFSEKLIKIHIFSFKKIHLKMSSGKWGPFCLRLNVLKTQLQDNSSTPIMAARVPCLIVLSHSDFSPSGEQPKHLFIRILSLWMSYSIAICHP